MISISRMYGVDVPGHDCDNCYSRTGASPELRFHPEEQRRRLQTGHAPTHFASSKSAKIRSSHMSQAEPQVQTKLMMGTQLWTLGIPTISMPPKRTQIRNKVTLDQTRSLLHTASVRRSKHLTLIILALGQRWPEGYMLRLDAPAEGGS